MARKAGKAVLGTEAVESSVLHGKAAMVILDDGAARNTKRRFLELCEDYKVPVMGLPAGVLADIYKWEKLVVASLEDEGFARAIDQAIRAKEPEM